jgi:hypothetical protein
MLTKLNLSVILPRKTSCRRVLAVIFLAALLAVTPSHLCQAQEPFCAACENTRWTNLGDALLRSAGNVKQARALLRRVEASGRTDLIRNAKALVERSTAEFEYLDRIAATVESTSYKRFLARHQADVEARFDATRLELSLKTEQLRVLERAVGADKRSQIGQLEAIAEEEAKQRRALSKDSGLGAIQAAALKIDLSLRLLRALPSGVIDWNEEIRRLERLSTAAKAIDRAQIGADAANGEYFKAGLEAGQTFLALIIPTAVTPKYKVFIAQAAKTKLEGLAAFPFFLTVGLDFADIGMSHASFVDAEERRQSVGDVEATWRFDIARLGFQKDNLDAERVLAETAIRRQALLEAQVATIRKELREDAR